MRDVVKNGSTTFTVETRKEAYEGYGGKRFDYLTRVTERQRGKWIEEARYPSTSEAAAADTHRRLVMTCRDK